MSELSHYLPRLLPGKTTLDGQHVKLEPINWAVHGQGLANAITKKTDKNLWTYIPFGPFDCLDGLQAVMSYVQSQFQWETMVVIQKHNNLVVGTASFMRIRPEHGSAELGCIIFNKELQKTAAATEVIYLLSAHLFDELGYRRNEWKCDNDNAASKKAALRFGYKYEGLFRNDLIIKQKNRDTAWFAMTDSDWPLVKAGFESWLNKSNFDNQGLQLRTLLDCRTV